MKAAELTAKITEAVERLAKETDAARVSEQIRAYLDTCAKFHRYSYHNQLLILAQRPHAQRVAGYNDWLKKHRRYVKRGEKGIAILAPCFKQEEKDNGEVTTQMYFRVVYVFDVSQTDGEPLAEPPQWKSPARNAELQARLTAFAESKGIKVAIEGLGGSTQGESRNGEIALDPTAGTETFIHELAHEVLKHHARDVARETMEIEAEAVGFVVAEHFELPQLGSPNYLALWNADGKKIRERLERIAQCAREIITAVEGGEDTGANNNEQ